ncbi:hypothetical protein CK203_044834 [Vitis vinifera]|uniref:Uncharacterized protein n=1 Tax=Vitis vinifera TaxID=29760 RepID=A0A438H0N6_VITVI|nr:hypothetical protein CK203_044834 [Vitis vinifera]
MGEDHYQRRRGDYEGSHGACNHIQESSPLPPRNSRSVEPDAGAGAWTASRFRSKIRVPLCFDFDFKRLIAAMVSPPSMVAFVHIAETAVSDDENVIEIHSGFSKLGDSKVTAQFLGIKKYTRESRANMPKSSTAPMIVNAGSPLLLEFCGCRTGSGIANRDPVSMLGCKASHRSCLPRFHLMAAGSSSLYGRLSETVVMGRGPWLVVVIACKTRFTLVNDPDNYIRMTHVGYPDVLWSGRIYGSRPDVYALFRFKLGLKNVLQRRKTTSSFRAGDAYEKSTDKLSVKEFRDRFCIPNGVIVEFLNGEDVVSTEKAEQDTVIFSKEQFNAGLRFPLPALFKEFLPFHPDSTRPHSSQHRPGADGMQHHKHAVQSRPHAAGELPDSTKGDAKGLVMVRGAWAGSKHPARPFSPNYSDSGSEKEGPYRGLGRKGVFLPVSINYSR